MKWCERVRLRDGEQLEGVYAVRWVAQFGRAAERHYGREFAARQGAEQVACALGSEAGTARGQWERWREGRRGMEQADGRAACVLGWRVPYLLASAAAAAGAAWYTAGIWRSGLSHRALDCAARAPDLQKWAHWQTRRLLAAIAGVKRSNGVNAPRALTPHQRVGYTASVVW
jgi:hypothetical protein